MRKYHRKWQTYDTINMSIGQGMVLINPLQLAVMASRLATGKRVVPRLLKSKPVVPQTQLAVDQDHLDFIRLAMAGVVDHGTAAGAKLPLDGIQMAGKTGTAQTHNLSASERGDYTAAQLEASRPLAVHGLRAVRQPALRGCGDRRAWRLRRCGRRTADPRHAACSSTTSRRRLAALHAFEQSIGGTLEERTGAQDRGVARRPMGCRHCPTTGMITSAIIPQPLARAAVAADLPDHSGSPAFGLIVLYSAAGGSIQPWALKQAIVFLRLPRASPSPCRG